MYSTNVFCKCIQCFCIRSTPNAHMTIKYCSHKKYTIYILILFSLVVFLFSTSMDFGPGHFTTASDNPFFNNQQLQDVEEFVSNYTFAKNSLGYSKRVLGGIMFGGVFLGQPSPVLEEKFGKCISVLENRIRKEFDDATLKMYSLEFTNQAFKQKSRWHKDLNDGYPYLNIFIPLDEINETNGMTTLKIDGGIVEMKCSGNHWYSFDGSITHCAGAGTTATSETPRRALMAVFRRASDPVPANLATARYKSVITRRNNKLSGVKRTKPEPVQSTRVLRLRPKKKQRVP